MGAHEYVLERQGALDICGDGRKPRVNIGSRRFRHVVSPRGLSIVVRITASMYSSGETPSATARSAISRVRFVAAPLGRPAPGRLPPGTLISHD
jgi:hypothetical protein